jgi:dienelactone hydrolase
MTITEKYPVGAPKFNIHIEPAPDDGKRYPIVVLVHGNFGLAPPYGAQLQSFAAEIAKLGYLAAVPSYYEDQVPHMLDDNIDSHVPALAAAIKHLEDRDDADGTRLGLVGFSLGGGISMAFINSSAKGRVSVFADFYGYVGPKLNDGVANFPPTIIFHNKNDRQFVKPHEHSEPLAAALAKEGIVYEPHPPYDWYDETWPEGFNHAFQPGGDADKDSRKRTLDWLDRHMKPVGK